MAARRLSVRERDWPIDPTLDPYGRSISMRPGPGDPESSFSTARRWVMSSMFSISGNSQVATNPQTDEQQLQFKLKKQALRSALARFSTQTGIGIVGDGALPQGAQSAPLEGQMSAREVLNHLLAGTNLSYRFSSATLVIISHRRCTGSEGAGSVAGNFGHGSGGGKPAQHNDSSASFRGRPGSIRYDCWRFGKPKHLRHAVFRCRLYIRGHQ